MPDLEQAAPSQPKKSNTGKILLGCAGVVIVLIAIAGFVGYKFVNNLLDPNAVKETFQSVTGTEVPAEFTPQTHMDLIFQYAVVQNEDNGHFLIVGQIEKGQGKMLQQQLRTITDAMIPTTGSETLEAEEFAMGEKKLTLSKLRHTSQSGGKLIEIRGKLPDRNGNERYVKYIGIEAAFDEAAFKSFLNQVK